MNRTLYLLLFLLGTPLFIFGQACATLDSWSFVSDNGDGTCTYDISIIVDSGNGASGTATFSIGGSTVHTENNCTCNPTTITFPVTVTCGSTINIDVVYDAPGNGNDCTGSTGDFTLPVEWLKMSLKRIGDDNQIEWSTQNEVNSEKFIVQHSFDGKTFRNLSEVSSFGNTDVINYYSYSHYYPLNRSCYYRVKQVDYDGNFSFSELLIFFREDQSDIDLYPNPVKNVVNFGGDIYSSWSIMSMEGKEIKRGSSSQVNLQLLDPGLYIVRFKTSLGTIVKQFIKL